jgi:hypothetical protein
MHPEYFTAAASNAADALGLEQPEGEQPEIDETLADPPPQAANPTPTVMRAATSPVDSQRRRGLLNA